MPTERTGIPQRFARNPVTGDWMRWTFKSSTRVGGMVVGSDPERYAEWPRVNFAEFADEPSDAAPRSQVAE